MIRQPGLPEYNGLFFLVSNCGQLIAIESLWSSFDPCMIPRHDGFLCYVLPFYDLPGVFSCILYGRIAYYITLYEVYSSCSIYQSKDLGHLCGAKGLSVSI